VAKAMPTLTQEQMLQATRLAKVQHFEAGSLILSEGTSGDLFYIVSKGTVEVVLQRVNAADVVAAQMGPGQFFGEMEFIHGQKRSASIRASEHGGPVEVLTLNFEALRELLENSETTRDEIERIADERRKQNLELRGES
jgi:CRP-like cAMP-binding protein